MATEVINRVVASSTSSAEVSHKCEYTSKVMDGRIRYRDSQHVPGEQPVCPCGTYRFCLPQQEVREFRGERDIPVGPIFRGNGFNYAAADPANLSPSSQDGWRDVPWLKTNNFGCSEPVERCCRENDMGGPERPGGGIWLTCCVVGIRTSHGVFFCDGRSMPLHGLNGMSLSRVAVVSIPRIVVYRARTVRGFSVNP